MARSGGKAGRSKAMQSRPLVVALIVIAGDIVFASQLCHCAKNRRLAASIGTKNEIGVRPALVLSGYSLAGVLEY
jgi:hypothetical protein